MSGHDDCTNASTTIKEEDNTIENSTVPLLRECSEEDYHNSSVEEKQHQIISESNDEESGIKKGMFGRRAWDDQAYEQRAMDRMNRGANFDTDDKRKPVVSRSEALQRKPLEAREGKLLSTENQVGKKGVVEITSDGKQLLPNSKTKVKSKQKEESVDPTKIAGFYCKVCDKNFRDSHAYVDHCNSKYHLSRMGVSNRAVKATADDVKQKLQAKIAAKKANSNNK